MEIDLHTDDGDFDRLEYYRSKVQTIYPKSYYVDGGMAYANSVIWWFKKDAGTYCVGVGSDEVEAWKDAWKRIENETLKMLEK